MKPLLREYIKDPKAKIPGTKMTFPGLKDPKQIDDIVAYLKQFKLTGKEVCESCLPEESSRRCSSGAVGGTGLSERNLMG